VVFRGAASVWPAATSWSDEYLRLTAGSEMVQVEERKKEDRLGNDQKWPLRRFLEAYRDPSSSLSLFAVDYLPRPLRKDCALPESYGPLMAPPSKPLKPSPFLWMSSGGTTSVFHLDSDENINCLVDGRKRFLLVSDEYVEDAYYSDAYPGYGWRSPFDVDAVDLLHYPRVAHMAWREATLEAGDCMFIPAGYMHAVRSYERNVAVSVWFQAKNATATAAGASGALAPFSGGGWPWSATRASSLESRRTAAF
jgi:lysine-specific demethylase 8